MPTHRVRISPTPKLVDLLWAELDGRLEYDDVVAIAKSLERQGVFVSYYIPNPPPAPDFDNEPR